MEEDVPREVDESLSFDASGKMTSGNTPLRPTSIDPATEPIHGCHVASTLIVQQIGQVDEASDTVVFPRGNFASGK